MVTATFHALPNGLQSLSRLYLINKYQHFKYQRFSQSLQAVPRKMFLEGVTFVCVSPLGSMQLKAELSDINNLTLVLD